MRDTLLVAVFAVAWLACWRRPVISPLLWAWISMMSPHRLTWSFAANLPFGQLTAVTTLVLFLFKGASRHPYPRNAVGVMLLVFYGWMCFTALNSINDPVIVRDIWIKVTKIQVMLFVTMMMVSGRRQIDWLIWVVALSVAFYGFKGGIFVLITGGGSRVWGPPGSFIESNNSLALALVMAIPLLYYLYGISQKKWMRRGLLMVMGLCLISILGSYSRGAFLAASTMALFMGLKSKRKVLTLLLAGTVLAGGIAFLPDKWSERMNTISTAGDHSAQSRLYTWKMILNFASTHALAGGGFDITANPRTWEKYAVTDYAKAYSPHSIYFQALAEHGYVGLSLYFLLGVVTWRLASRVARHTREGPDADWAPQLMGMIQVSLVGFAVGGTFSGLLNYDLPYYLAAIVAMVARDTCPRRAPVPAAGGPALAGAPR